MGRIVTPDLDDDEESGKTGKKLASKLHDYTHGITSDPITLFAILFSALVHDIDHRGVSNAQLAQEDEQMAALYQNQSIAEQNSLDKAWDILMEDSYIGLRSTLFVDRSELLRFRQVVVQVVLATDIFDKELNDLRKKRWEMAFNGESTALHNDLRATIVIEHVSLDFGAASVVREISAVLSRFSRFSFSQIIQASDVAHTMQVSTTTRMPMTGTSIVWILTVFFFRTALACLSKVELQPIP